MFKDKNEIPPSPWKSPFALSQRVWTTIRCTVTKSLNSNQMHCNKEFEQQPDALSQRVWTATRCTVTKSLDKNLMHCYKEFGQQLDVLSQRVLIQTDAMSQRVWTTKCSLKLDNCLLALSQRNGTTPISMYFVAGGHDIFLTRISTFLWLNSIWAPEKEAKIFSNLVSVSPEIFDKHITVYMMMLSQLPLHEFHHKYCHDHHEIKKTVSWDY